MELLSGSSANIIANNNSINNVQNFIYPLAAIPMNNSKSPQMTPNAASSVVVASTKPMPSSRYEGQKRRDWNTFNQYLGNHRPPVPISICGGSNVLEFLKYLDQFGKTKVHIQSCPYFGLPNPPSSCPCPLRQAWGSLDALIGRLRAAYDEHGGKPESNPFGARGVKVYLREVREYQAKARGISYDKKRKRTRRKEDHQRQLLSLPTTTITTPPAAISVSGFAQRRYVARP